MTPEVRAFIVKCFCRKVSASEVAYCTNKMFVMDIKVSADTVQRIWNQERSCNTIIRELESKLGERPAKGYVPCEHVRLAERLAAV